jgi:short-subunit dehydrogenase
MTDVDVEGLDRAANAIDGPTRTRQLDVTDAADFRNAAEEAESRDGAVDYLFNNAGIAVIGRYGEMTMEDFNRLIDVNLRGVIHGIDAVYARMCARRSGHIVNTASVSGLIPAPGFTMYSATKHAVVGLSRGLRAEASRFGVKVSSVCPGFIDTAIVTNADYRGIDGATAKERSPFKFASPESCARDALDGVAKNDAEIVVTRHAKAMVAAQRFAPGLMGFVGRKSLKRSLS